jgi:integrase
MPEAMDGTAKTASTWTLPGTGTWVRSRSATALTGSGSGGRSPARPSKSANNVIRAFRIITKKAGLGEDWVPREMRHTFVSALSANGVPVVRIALLAGHHRTATTASVYRHEIRPALTQGVEVMDKIFG